MREVARGHRRTLKRRRIKRRLAPFVLLALLAAAPTLWGAGHAAFAALTANPTNAWSTGSVSIGDDDSSAVMFTGTGLLPGGGGVKCLVVTYTGTLSTSVKIYATAYSTGLAAGAYLNLTIEEGTGSSFAGSGPNSCPGFVPTTTVYAGTLDGFAATSTSYATGVGSFAPTGSGQTKVYRISYNLDSAAPDTVQAGTAGVGFVWSTGGN